MHAQSSSTGREAVEQLSVTEEVSPDRDTSADCPSPFATSERVLLPKSQACSTLPPNLADAGITVGSGIGSDSNHIPSQAPQQSLVEKIETLPGSAWVRLTASKQMIEEPSTDATRIRVCANTTPRMGASSDRRVADAFPRRVPAYLQGTVDPPRLPAWPLRQRPYFQLPRAPTPRAQPAGVLHAAPKNVSPHPVPQIRPAWKARARTPNSLTRAYRLCSRRSCTSGNTAEQAMALELGLEEGCGGDAATTSPTSRPRSAPCVGISAQVVVPLRSPGSYSSDLLPEVWGSDSSAFPSQQQQTGLQQRASRQCAFRASAFGVNARPSTPVQCHSPERTCDDLPVPLPPQAAVVELHASGTGINDGWCTLGKDAGDGDEEFYCSVKSLHAGSCTGELADSMELGCMQPALSGQEFDYALQEDSLEGIVASTTMLNG